MGARLATGNRNPLRDAVASVDQEYIRASAKHYLETKRACQICIPVLHLAHLSITSRHRHGRPSYQCYTVAVQYAEEDKVLLNRSRARRAGLVEQLNFGSFILSLAEPIRHAHRHSTV